MSDRDEQLRTIELDSISDGWEDRKGAAQALAGLAYGADLAPVLRVLLLDPMNTAVTVEAATMALGFGDPEALAVLLGAYRDGDEETGFHIAIEVAAYVSDDVFRARLTELRGDASLAQAVQELETQMGWTNR